MSRSIVRLCIVLSVLILLNLPAASVQAKEFMGVSSPKWSPDGQHIAFSVRNQGKSALYVVGADGSNPTKLTDNADSPNWSPDGKRIGYVEFRGNTSIIYAINLDGSERARIAEGYQPSWSPDGRQLAYAFNEMLYVANADGSDPRRLLKDVVLHVWSYRWSPVGARLAVAMGSAGDNRARVYVVNADGSDLHEVADGVDSLISWSPDGRQIVFSGDCGPNGEDGMCIVSADGSTTRKMISRSGQAPQWSPDGERIAFVLNGAICVSQIDGSNERCLTASSSNDWLAPSAWSPDSKQLLITRSHLPETNNGESAFFYFEALVVNVDGSGMYSLPDGIETM
jgi:Tol biopolymer transport system component